MSTTDRIVFVLLVFFGAVSGVWGQQPGFGGPAILSVPGSPIGRTGGVPIAFRFYAGIHANYATNLGNLLGDPAAEDRNRDYYGGIANWGVYGVQQRRRDFIALDYSGTYQKYQRSIGRQGLSNFLDLSYARQVSARTDFSISVGAGTFDHAGGWYRNSVLQSPTPDITDPTAEVFDGRTDYVSSGAGVRHMVSQSVAVSLSGGGFLVARRDQRFIDSQGAYGGGGVSKALGPSRNIGASYRYFYYFHPNGFGQYNTHTATLHYSQDLTQYWRLAIGAGVTYVDAERLQAVALDPLLASITGQSSVLRAIRTTLKRPTGSITISRAFERSSLSFYYRKGMNPGSAFTTTSFNDSGGISYSYTATDKLNVGLTVSASSRSPILENAGRFVSYGGSTGVSYRLWSYLHLTTRAGAYSWSLGPGDLDRTRMQLSVGLSFSPGDTPLALF